MKRTGFTLIELLVVVAIIGILASVAISSLGAARTRAGEARTKVELNQMKTTIVGAQIGLNQTVYAMTGSTGTYLNCPTSTDLSSLSSSHACVSTWRTAIDTIVTNYDSGQSDGALFYTDTWGSPYLLDENEDTVPMTPCLVDTIGSAGADRTIGTADDIYVVIPFESCN